MQVLKDKDGVQWEIVIDLDALDRVQAEADVDLADTDKGAPVFSLLDDFRLTGKCLRAICRPQMPTKDVDDAGFNRKFSSGEILIEAAKKIWKEMEDFFPPKMRIVFAQESMILIEANKQQYEMAQELIDSGRVQEELTTRVEKAKTLMREVLSGEKSFDSLASLASNRES
jgi:hypothetical protein